MWIAGLSEPFLTVRACVRVRACVGGAGPEVALCELCMYSHSFCAVLMLGVASLPPSAPP